MRKEDYSDVRVFSAVNGLVSRKQGHVEQLRKRLCKQMNEIGSQVCQQF